MTAPNLVTPAIPLSVAPMMDWTDRHCRYFHRLLSRSTLLYTEMVTTGAVLHGDRERLLGFDAAEHPVALQLGGSDPADLAACARIAEEWGYDEVNLNVGCPSDRVQSGRFGACLMAEPDLVARLVGAMRDAVSIPVTVKSRIAIDEMEEWPTLDHFIRTVSAAGCTHFIVHARKAWLKGLSPKENRDIPPLRYDLVHRLKAENPHLTIAINGGIKTLDEAEEHLGKVDSVMIGRAAYETPYLLADADRRLMSGEAGPDRHAVIDAMLPYIEARMARGTPLSSITRHMLGLFQGLPGARAYRRHIAENAHRPGAGPEVLERAASLVRRRADDEAVVEAA
ncbi:tRNA-dihydrouridine synthase A [Azospirillum sp. TSH7]|uniref:tRNA dihydrouridine(20/20a) synthase DusA n=1 Tax=unclassified Azospirillum TaxID=2630922 RepID=UPI000D60B938|nr:MULTISPECIES: tRNA dihydrouridine(20/20a) synthase DusA [unclassified Azospirillum]PWC60189.1 tRNA-dihydrouridine synthase A [Azospirillum sp. TSH20]PWC68972.1 tRNA-dihydrouridine synthase A [Azospirillum sp. TSH7]